MENRMQRNDFEATILTMMDGDRVAVARVYRKFYNPLLRYGVIILPDQRAVEDQIQDLFVWFLEHPQTIENGAEFRDVSLSVEKKV